MTREEALKLKIADSIYIYDPGLRKVYEAVVTGVTMVNVNAKTGSIKGFMPSITAWSKLLASQRVYRSDEVHLAKVTALMAQANQLQLDSDKINDAKFKVDQQIEELS